ncbi:MAG: heme-binding protein [Nonomuraea sp.]|nr:heme-binding protein [Nonomuraea sp.]
MKLALAVAALLPMAVAAPAHAAPDPKTVTQISVLTADAAIRAGQAAMAEAVKQKQRVTVAIVDRSGATRLILKGDGAGPQTEESAKRKAYTAVAFGQPTSKLSSNQSLASIPDVLLLAGGVPVASGGSPIAGIGVGGAPSGDIDESIANAGLNAIKDQLD